MHTHQTKKPNRKRLSGRKVEEERQAAMNTHTHMHTKKPKRKLEKKRKRQLERIGGKQRSVERKEGRKQRKTKETHARTHAANIAHRAPGCPIAETNYTLHAHAHP
jgi:hypothetical protein